MGVFDSLKDFGKSIGGPLAGGLISGGFGLLGQNRQEKAAKKEAQRNRDFQERMSSTAYQRAMGDMRKAGLNPILAYRQGGASTPGGAMAQIPNFGAIGSDIATGMTAGARSAMTGAEIALTQAQARKTGYEADILQPVAAVKGLVGDVADGGVDLAKDLAGSAGSSAKDVLETIKEGLGKVPGLIAAGSWGDHGGKPQNRLHTKPVEITPGPKWLVHYKEAERLTNAGRFKEARSALLKARSLNKAHFKGRKPTAWERRLFSHFGIDPDA